MEEFMLMIFVPTYFIDRCPRSGTPSMRKREFAPSFTSRASFKGSHT